MPARTTGENVEPEIMVPLVATKAELDTVKAARSMRHGQGGVGKDIPGTDIVLSSSAP